MIYINRRASKIPDPTYFYSPLKVVLNIKKTFKNFAKLMIISIFAAYL